MIGTYVRKSIHFFLNVLLPVVCVECGKEGRYVCEKCEVFVCEASAICPMCEKASFFGNTHEHCQGRFSMSGLTSVWEYEGVVQTLIHSIKYKGVFHAIEETVEHAMLAMAKDKERFFAFFEFLFHADTVISYVPMVKKKEKIRGFNQARLVALRLAALAQGKQIMKTLEKTKDNSSQTDLTRESRIANVKDSFKVVDRLSLSTRRVALVDDVWTSGATMRECARVLKKSGVGEVWGFTLAKTP